MGRVVQVDQLGSAMSQDHVQQGLLRSAAARASNQSLEEFEQNLAELLILLPFLQKKLVVLHPVLLGQLVKDVPKTAAQIIALHQMLPEGSNIESILSQRPALLLEDEFVKIPKCLESLRDHYDDEAIREIASSEPLLLVEDVNTVLRELERSDRLVFYLFEMKEKSSALKKKKMMK